MDKLSKTISPEALINILKNHQLWLGSKGQKGERANLEGAILVRTNLFEAHLFEANLEGANLRGADLRGADLREADLREADLREADLREADLRGTDLSKTQLSDKQLRESINDFEAPTLNHIELEKELNQLKSKVEQTEREKQKLAEKLGEADLTEKEREALEEENQELIQKLERLTQAEEDKTEIISQKNQSFEEAIQEIEIGTNPNQDLINQHKRQSFILLVSGLIAIILAVTIALNFALEKTQLEVATIKFEPKFLFPLFFISVGVALLRHDWKIRQILAGLLNQQQKATQATSLLKASLALEKFDAKSGKVEQTFDAVTQALLDVSPKSNAFKEDKNVSDELSRHASQLDKVIKLLGDK